MVAPITETSGGRNELMTILHRERSDPLIGAAGGGKSRLVAPFGIRSFDNETLAHLGLNGSHDTVKQSLQDAEQRIKQTYQLGLIGPYEIGSLPTPTLIAAAKENAFYDYIGQESSEMPPIFFNDWTWAIGDEKGPKMIINQPSCIEDCNELMNLYTGEDQNATHLYSISGNARHNSFGQVHIDHSLVRLGKINKNINRAILDDIIQSNINKVTGGIDGITALEIGLVEPEDDKLPYRLAHQSMERSALQRIIAGNPTQNIDLEKGSWAEMGAYELRRDDQGKLILDEDEILIIRELCLGLPRVQYDRIRKARLRNEIMNIEVKSPIPDHLYPFHPDSRGKMPVMITNGGDWKEPLARSIGCGAIRDTHIKEATGAAEDKFHTRFGDDALGPALLQGSPYPLVLAAEKLEAGRKVLEKDGMLESFFTTDTTYRVTNPVTGEDYTLHKPKTEADTETITRLLSRAAECGRAHLSAVAGIARYDVATKIKEYFTTELDLGIVQPFETSTLVNRLRKNASKPLGTSTFDMQDFLIKTQPHYKVTVAKYIEGIHKLQVLIPETSGDLVFNPKYLHEIPSDDELRSIGITVSSNTLNHRYQKIADGSFDISGDRSSGNDFQSWLYMISLGYIPK